MDDEEPKRLELKGSTPLTAARPARGLMRWERELLRGWD